MKEQLTYIFIISLFFGGYLTSHAQVDAPKETATDSITYTEKYGLRIGVDLSKPIRGFFDEDYTGFEIKGDFRITKRLYPAVEIGYENREYSENNFSANSEGSYIKVGANYNVYNNPRGLHNSIYVGLRYGFATYSETLYSYTIYKKQHYFPPDVRTINEKFKGLNAHWIEFQVGLKAELFNNLYIGLHAELKHSISVKTPAGFGVHYIPGFNRNYEHSAFGVGWGYSMSYLIPIIKKEHRVKKP